MGRGRTGQRNPSPRDGRRGRAGSRARPTGRRWLDWRPGLWLTTLSTVLAVATGMFTLRDRIFPSDSGTAAASPAAFEESVAQICDALNAANAARPRETRALMAKLRASRTAVEARNALLDSWNHNLSVQQTQLSTLEGLDVPAGFRASFQTTTTAWALNVTRVRGFTQHLDAASSARDVVAAVRTLPALRTLLAGDAVTTDAGLRKLGGGRCQLQRPADVPVVTLPASLAFGPSVNPPVTAGSKARAKAPTHPKTATPAPAPVASAPPPPQSSGGATAVHVSPNAAPPQGAPIGPQVEPGAASSGGSSSAGAGSSGGSGGGGGSAATASGG